MDIKELVVECGVFANACDKSGLALDHFCLIPTIEGSADVYTMNINATWIDGMACSKAIDRLSTIMWEVMSVEARRKIFSINIFDENDELHCISEELLLVDKGEILAA